LFKAIEALDEDDNEALAESLSGTELITNLAVYRNRLQVLILRSLRTLYASRWAGSEIRQMLEEVELLYERRMYALCQKRLEKALDLARMHQQESMLLEICEWRRKLVHKASLSHQNELLDEIWQEEVACLQRIQVEREASNAHERMRVGARLRLISRTNEEAGQPASLTPAPHSNFIAQIHQLSALGIVAFSKNEFQFALEIYDKIMGLWESEPMRILDHPDIYLQTYNNHLGGLLIGGQNHSKFLQSVHKLRQLDSLPRHTRVHFQWVAFHQELVFSMNFSGYEATLALVLEIEAWIAANTQEILTPRLLAFYFNITMFFFVNGEYARANKWLGRILNQPGQAERRDIRNFARILQVLLQYEMKDFDLNEYLVRSAYRYLNRKDELYAFEMAIFDLIRQCTNHVDEASRQPVYEAFKASMQEFRSHNQSALGHGELLLWVESKLTGVSPRLLFEHKLRENQAAASMP
jgi:hypothetical protein